MILQLMFDVAPAHTRLAWDGWLHSRLHAFRCHICTPSQGVHEYQEIVCMAPNQAKEFGEAEVWMNERLMRAAPKCFAQFITAFEDGERPLGRAQPGLVRTQRVLGFC